MRHAIDSKRHGTLDRLLLLAGVVEAVREGTIREIHAEYCRRVEDVCERTVRRYLLCMERNSVIEVIGKRPSRVGTASDIYRWSGWPPPIH